VGARKRWLRNNLEHAMTEPELVARPVLDAVRQARRDFLATLEPLRPDLHRYARRLAGNVWDAEDLVQETLMRAFARAAQTPGEIRHPLAWLLRIATNVYIDSRRRPAPTPTPHRHDQVAPPGTDPGEVRDALAEVTTLLAPQERAAIVLREAFDLPLADIAAMLSTSVGAVKAALHRGRDRLTDPDREQRRSARPAPSRAVLDALASAFTAYDLSGLAALFLEDAVSEIVGVRHETGRESIRDGSLRYTLFVETDVRLRASVEELFGEPVVVLWETPVRNPSEPFGLGDVLRLDTVEDCVSRLRWYYFCPEALVECARELGGQARTHGYG
jgi:RNA polymerase sigma-70 factor, ECF subfamily